MYINIKLKKTFYIIKYKIICSISIIINSKKIFGHFCKIIINKLLLSYIYFFLLQILHLNKSFF